MATKFINLNPEQEARLRIDQMLDAAGWTIQNKDKVNLGAATSIAIREYSTDIGPADYVLFVDRKPVGMEFIELADALEQLTGRRVDLVSRNGLSVRSFNFIKEELIYV